MDEADGSQHDHGRRWDTERLSLSAARSRYQVWRIIWRHSGVGGNQTAGAAAAKSQLERAFGAVESIGEGGMLVENDFVRRGLPPARAFELRRTFPQRKEPSRERKCDLVPDASGQDRGVNW